ncbi:MAG: ATP-binding protein [Alphaproteobacteria bacterium]|nr:ATP-binding protein [Alphaproteobacteria bacterium]
MQWYPRFVLSFSMMCIVLVVVVSYFALFSYQQYHTKQDIQEKENAHTALLKQTFSSFLDTIAMPPTNPVWNSILVTQKRFQRPVFSIPNTEKNQLSLQKTNIHTSYLIDTASNTIHAEVKHQNKETINYTQPIPFEYIVKNKRGLSPTDILPQRVEDILKVKYTLLIDNGGDTLLYTVEKTPVEKSLIAKTFADLVLVHETNIQKITDMFLNEQHDTTGAWSLSHNCNRVEKEKVSDIFCLQSQQDITTTAAKTLATRRQFFVSISATAIVLLLLICAYIIFAFSKNTKKLNTQVEALVAYAQKTSAGNTKEQFPTIPVQSPLKILFSSFETITNTIKPKSMKTANRKTIAAFRPTNIIELIKDIKATLSPLLHKKDISLNIPKDKKSILLSTERMTLSNIIIELISNAYKHTNNRGTILMTLNTDTRNIILSIRDTGKGIPAHSVYALNAFFEKKEAALGKVDISTGLYTIKQSLSKIHATLSFESVVGIGTTAKLTIPYHPDIKKDTEN